jgi:hypothetical protein
MTTSIELASPSSDLDTAVWALLGASYVWNSDPHNAATSTACASVAGRCVMSPRWALRGAGGFAAAAIS